MTTPVVGSTAGFLPAVYEGVEYGGKLERSVTVFGSSVVQRGTADWERAQKVGNLFASSGFSVITGGYLGSMEAVSEGAAQAALSHPNAAGVVVEGILVPALFPHRAPHGNAFLTKQTNTNSLVERLGVLTSRSRYYIVLPGTLGTLTELSLIWCHSMVHPEGLPKPRIFAFRNPWETLIHHCAASLNLAPEVVGLVEYVDTPEEALAKVLADEEAMKASRSALSEHNEVPAPV